LSVNFGTSFVGFFINKALQKLQMVKQELIQGSQDKQAFFSVVSLGKDKVELVFASTFFQKTKSILNRKIF
jgi:hypothetical protein